MRRLTRGRVCFANEAWQAALADIKRRSGSKWDLSMFLIVPVQRVPRYELLLKQLLAHTLPSNADYGNTAAALVLVQGVNERINKDKRVAEERREVAQTLARISKLPDESSTSRRVVRAGELLSLSFSADKERRGQCQRKVQSLVLSLLVVVVVVVYRYCCSLHFSKSFVLLNSVDRVLYRTAC